MKYSNLNNRIDKLEKQEHESKRTIKIASMHYDKWAVLRDHMEFDTLAEAVAYVRRKYNSHSIKVCQAAYVMHNMPDDTLRVLASLSEDNQQNTQEQEKAIQQVQEPCDQLQQVQQDNSKISFELFYMTNEEQDEYFKTKH